MRPLFFFLLLLVFVLVGFSLLICKTWAIPAPSAFWSFDNYTGTGDVYDDYGNHPLTPENNATYTANGGVDGTGAFFLDGYSDRLEAVHFDSNELMPKNNQITISAWFNMTSLDNHQWGPFQHPIALWNGYHLRLFEDRKGIGFSVFYGIYGEEVPLYYYSDSELWNFNEWHHIAGVYDGTTMKLYFDGEKKATKYLGYNINDSTIYTLMLGAVSWSGAKEELHGYVDNIGIWQVALTDEDIAELYRIRYPGGGVNPVPVPSTLSLLGTGLVPMFWRLRKAK